jgi:hypothetical protein
MQVINFKQGEEEGIVQAWNRFNELVEQGPRLGFPGDVLLHTFFFSLTPSCMRYVEMCAGGDLMEKTFKEAAQLLQKISKAAAMQRDWETPLSGKSKCDTSVRPLAGILGNTVLEEKKEEPIPKKVEEIKHAETRTIPESDHVETSKASERTMSSAKPLREFEQMYWVPIDFGEILRLLPVCH